jgi:hypothetical protein
MSLLLDTRSGIVCRYIDSSADDFHYRVTMAPLFGSGSVTRDGDEVLVLPPNVVPFPRALAAGVQPPLHSEEPGRDPPHARPGDYSEEAAQACDALHESLQRNNPFSPSIA